MERGGGSGPVADTSQHSFKNQTGSVVQPEKT
jgi:hypothetical protein